MTTVPVLWSALKVRDIVDVVTTVLSEYGYNVERGMISDDIRWYREYGHKKERVNLLRSTKDYRYDLLFMEHEYCRIVEIDLGELDIRIVCKWRYPWDYKADVVMQEVEVLNKVVERVVKLFEGV